MTRDKKKRVLRVRIVGLTAANLDNLQRDGRACGVSVLHVSFEVHVEKLEDEVELRVCVDNLEESARFMPMDRIGQMMFQ